MHNFGWYGMLGWLGMLTGLILTVAVIIGIVWLVVWAVRRGTTGTWDVNRAAGIQAQPSAREILQMRYARGEITREQYQQMLSDIQ